MQSNQSNQTVSNGRFNNVFGPVIRYFRSFRWNSNSFGNDNSDYQVKSDLESASIEPIVIAQTSEVKEVKEQLEIIIEQPPVVELEELSPSPETSASQPAAAPLHNISTAAVLSAYAKFVFAKENRKNLAAASLLTVFGSALNYLAPYTFGVLIELLGKKELNDEESNILLNILCFTSIYTLSQLVPNLRDAYVTTISARTNEKMITAVVQHQTEQTYKVDRNTSPGTKIYNVQQAWVANALTPLLTNGVPIVLESSIAVGALSYQYGPPIGVGLAITLALYTAYCVLTTKAIINVREETLKNGNEAFNKIEFALNKYKVIHDFNKTDAIIEEMKAAVHEAANTDIKAGKLPLKIGVGHIAISRLGMILAAVYAGTRVQNNQLTVPEYVALVGYLNQLCASMPNMGQALNQIFSALPALKRVINKVHDTSNNIVDLYPDIMLDVDNNSASIRFENVKFSYSEDTPILNNFSLDIKPGQMVALVSESGGGKSSLFNLLYGYYAPLSGEIFINEDNISSVGRHSLQENIGLIQQEANLFMGSVRDNIKFGAKNSAEVTDEMLFKLAQDLNLAGFICCSLAKENEINLTNFAKGLDISVGLDGSKLSGGQQHRVAILRGFLKKAPIRLLDEITTGLDADSTTNLLAGIDKLTRDEGSTVIVITHHLREIISADKIVVLKDGKRIAEGQHTELLRTCSLYYNLWIKQCESKDEKVESIIPSIPSVTSHMGLFPQSNSEQSILMEEVDALPLLKRAPKLTRRNESDDEK